MMFFFPTLAFWSLFTTCTFLTNGYPISECDQGHGHHETQFDRVIAFGDSYLDNGNGSFALTNHTWPADPAYYNGRFSNGPTWVEYLSESITPESTYNLRDHAYGGATINNTLTQGGTGYNSTIPVPSVLDQVHSYLATHDHIHSDRTLFVLDGGGNDAFFGSLSGLGFEELAMDAARSLLAAIKRLESHGARNFLVPSKPDLSHSPYARNNLNDTARADLDTFAKVFAQTISKEWEKTLGNKVRITLVDQNSILDGVAHHFKNTNDACLTGVYAGVDDGVRTLCEDPQKYLFWDAYHPTTDAHKMLAREALKALASNKHR